ncbi:MAG: ATP-binding protein, partial [Candidatus Micrarchaeota archaeon]
GILQSFLKKLDITNNMDFKTVIREQKEELEEIERTEKIIPRDALREAKKFLGHPNILAVLGVRRCGKSVFSYLLAKEISGEKNFGYINFDDERLAEVKTSDLNDILQAFYELYGDVDCVVLDEAQNVEKWELFANRLRRTKRVIITGSNSELLSGELATRLTGRHVDVTLYPFSFKEFVKFKNKSEESSVTPTVKQPNETAVYTTKEKAGVLRFLNEYLTLGGFPETSKFGKTTPAKIYNDVLTKDVLLKHGIRKKEAIKNLARYLVTNSAGEITYTKLAKIFGVKNVSTLSNWVSFLEDAFLIIKLERFAFKLKQQFVAPKKVYCVDNGMVNAVGFTFSENAGKLMENAVAVELQRRKAGDSEFATGVYYWKDHQQNEVDFVVKKGARVTQLVQVTRASDASEVNEREVKALLKASRQLRCGDLLVITWDYEGAEKIKGKRIAFTPLWKWLLE